AHAVALPGRTAPRHRRRFCRAGANGHVAGIEAMSSSAMSATRSVGRYGAALRQEICARNLEFSKKNKLAHCLSYGETPVVCYEPANQTHGNFLPATYRAIIDNPLWARRLKKA